MKNKFSIAISLAVILAVLVTSLALASDVSVAVVDVTAPTGSVTLAPGANGAITINMSVTGKQDGTATFEVNRDWTLSGGSFAGSNPQQFTVGPRAAGDPATTFSTSGTVTVAEGQANGTFTLLVSAFDITNSNATGAKLSDGSDGNYSVTVFAPPPPPSNTAPSVSVTGVSDSASYNKGSVPAATCQVTDAEDGNSTFAATLSAVTGTYASDGIGSQTASCSYTDGGGLSASASATYSIVDPSVPSISYALNPASADGSNGWYKSSVTLTWTVSEAESPNSLQKTGCVDQNITADQQDTQYSCSATSAGGSALPVTASIKRDATAPSISGIASPAANSAGWNNQNVTVSFSCSDATSLVASCEPNQTLTADGYGQSVTGNAADNAGNTNSATVNGINIDKTAPVVTVTGVSNGASYILGSVPTAGCSTSDTLSGVATNASLSVSGGPVGSVTASCSGASDVAGNAGSASVTYTVLYNWSGFFQPIDNNGVFNVAKSGSTIPVKFSLGGDQGLAILFAGSPSSVQVTCPLSSATDAVEEVTTATSGLKYDALANQYIYNWKTLSGYAGTCRQLTVKLVDGSTHTALFKFTR